MRRLWEGLRRQRLSRLVGLAGALVGALCAVRAGADLLLGGERLSGEQAVVLGVFLLTVLVGELNRISLPGASESAPMSVAAAYGLAMTSDVGDRPLHLDADLVVATITVAMASGLLLRRRQGHEGERGSLPARFLGVVVAVTLFRLVPWWHGETLVALYSGRRMATWGIALAMVVVAVLALTTESLVTASVKAVDDHVPWRVALLDELQQVLGLSTALAASGPLIALAEPALGVVAIPVFLLPLVLTQFAVRRYAGIRETYRQTIRTLSRLTEVGGYTRADHPERVARLSVGIGRVLGVPAKDLVGLEYAALLHDIGQLSLRMPIPGGATMLAAPADQDLIARDSAEIVRNTGVLADVADILEVQAKPYRHVRELGENLPLAARIIKVANAYDDLAGERPTRASREAAVERIHLGLGYEYDPAVVDALELVLSRRGEDVTFEVAPARSL